MRDQFIAQNLEKLYADATARGLALVSIYGHLHVPSLRAKLEAKGFEVIADNMAALERALNPTRPSRDEL